MILNVIKPKTMFFSADCFIVVNGKKHIVNQDLVLEINEKTCSFYVGMFYIKSKVYQINNDVSSNIIIDRIINKNKLLLLMFLFVVILLLNYFYESTFIDIVSKIFIYGFLGFSILINTVARRYFFTVKIVKEN